MRLSSLADAPPALRALIEAQHPELAKPRATRPSADKAAAFGAYWRMDPSTRGLPSPVAEWRFAPPRRWRFDFAWPELRIAVEVDGGQWKPGGGKHGSDADREKLNHAAALGWAVFRVSPGQLKREAPAFVAMVAARVREGVEKRGGWSGD